MALIGDPIRTYFKYRDLTTRLELYQNLQGEGEFLPGISVVSTTVCERNSTGDVFSCKVDPWSSFSQPNLKSCFGEIPNPPIKMNSLSYGSEPGDQLKTVVSETHPYKCTTGNNSIPDKVKDVVLFTSYYDMGWGATNLLVATCVKDINTASYNYCLYSPNIPGF